MKKLKILFLICFTLLLIYVGIGWFLKMSFVRKVGRINIDNRKTYLEFTHIDEFRDFDDLNFDFYRNDSLIIEQKYFDSTDGEPQISDFKVRNYAGLYYVTYFDSTKVKIICDNKMSIIFPTDYGGVKEDSVSKLPKVKKLLTDKRLTLGRW